MNEGLIEKMKKVLKKVLPQSVVEFIQARVGMFSWKKRRYLEYSPQVVKQSIFLKYGIEDGVWVETGTYLGTTTRFLSVSFPHVYSIEPEPKLYELARKRFSGQNVTLFNDISENIFPTLLPKLSGNINFWLDGHYSSGITFMGEKACPVEDELNAIEANIQNFDKLTILIDDVRCFLSSNNLYAEYPSIDYLVDWARRMKLKWRIEHDIFIMQKLDL